MVSTKKVEKDRLASDLTELFGVKDKVDFSKLSLEELRVLSELFSKVSNIIPIMAKSGRMRTENLLSKPLGEILGKIDADDGGILGLGIWPRFRSRIKEIEQPPPPQKQQEGE